MRSIRQILAPVIVGLWVPFWAVACGGNPNEAGMVVGEGPTVAEGAPESRDDYYRGMAEKQSQLFEQQQPKKR